MISSIVLTPLSAADGPLFFSLASDPEVSRFMRFGTLTQPEQGDSLARQYTSDGNLAWGITAEDSGEIVGVAALKLPDHGDPYRSISIFLARSVWGKGYAKTAILMLQGKAHELGFPVLSGFVQAHNAASRRLFEQCGFRLMEVFRFPNYPDDLLLYHWHAEGSVH